jgi:hypothetical protein
MPIDEQALALTPQPNFVVAHRFVCTHLAASAHHGGGPSGRRRVEERTGEHSPHDGTEQLTFDGKPLYFYFEEVPQLDPQTGNPENPATLGTGNDLAGPGHDGKFKVVAATS